MIPRDLWHEVVWSDKDFTVVADSSETRGMPNTDYDVYVNRTGQRIGCTNALCWEPQVRGIMKDYRENHQLRKLREMKKKWPEILVLFREKDRYVALLEDADLVRDMVETPMRVRNGGIRYSCFNTQALDTILPMLVRRGVRVVIED